MVFTKRIGRFAGSWLLVYCVSGCADDEEGRTSRTRWKCYDDPGQCDCAELEPDDLWDSSGTVVSECPSYTECVRYYDSFFEWNGCSCGPADLMPSNATDIEVVAACPP